MKLTRKRKSTGSVTIADVAAHANVGTMTVSRAIRTPEAVSEKLRIKIQKAVDELGYIPNKTAGALASGQTHNIEVIVHSLQDQFTLHFLPSFQNILNHKGYQVHYSYSGATPEIAEQLIEIAIGSRPAAIIICGHHHTTRSHTLLSKANCKVIDIADSSTDTPFTHIGIEHYAASYEGTKHLLKSGYKNIGFIGARYEQITLQQQLKGWQTAMLSSYYTPDHFLTSDSVPSVQLGMEGLSKLLLRDACLDALICTHEEVALGVLFECQRRHIKVPDEMAILCLENGEISENTHPRISGMKIDYKALGKQTAQNLLAALLKDKDLSKINVKPELVIRSTTK